MGTVAEGEKNSSSEIRQYFCNKNVFVTGGVGFVGKVLLHKLLKSCENIGFIYVLIRPKKGENAEERCSKQILNTEPFQELSRTNPKVLQGELKVLASSKYPFP